MTNQSAEQKIRNLVSGKLGECTNTATALIGNNESSESGDITLNSLKDTFLMKAYKRSFNTTSSDELPGLVELLTQAINAPSPAVVGRSLVNVMTTTFSGSVKIRLPKLATASSTNANRKGKSVGERNDFVILDPQDEIEDSETWDTNDLENMPWNVAQSQIAALGIGHDIKETKKILAFYNTLPIAKIATGAVMKPTTQFTLGWADIVNMWVELGDFTGDALMMNKKTYGLILKDQDFKDQQILGSVVDPRTGQMGSILLGFTIFVSTLQDDNVVLAIDTAAAGQYLIRRNKVLKSGSFSLNSFEAQVSSRVDLKLGRDFSIARMDISLAP